MALGERFTHVSDTVLYYPRKHKSSVPSLELTDNSRLLVEGGTKAAPALRYHGEVDNNGDTIASFFSKRKLSQDKEEDGNVTISLF